MPPRIGIDLGGTKIEGVVLDDAGDQVLRRERVPTESARGYDHIVETVAALVERLRAAHPDCASIGIGTPGAISSRTGLMKNSNTACLNGRDLPGDLARRLGRPLIVENDANCFALAEARRGAGQGARLVFGVIMGTGVGGGLVIDGRLWSGPQHIAGEWGHHVIDAQGPPCYCGQRGCVEALISGPAVERRYRELGGSGADMPAIVARARAGEALAARVFDEFLAHFGRAVANLINILDPDVVVLGGGLSLIDELYGRGRDAVARRVFNDELRTPIRRHQLGDSAGVIGAALLG
ncbi:MAG TPA: ROK family protein [Candidatus Dormibacteraeota bacterium]|nr:ROK family protein [Candidatus Dormibacteraeota bacterium]